MAHHSLINAFEISLVSLSHSFSFFERLLKKGKLNVLGIPPTVKSSGGNTDPLRRKGVGQSSPLSREGQAWPLLVGQLVDRLPLQGVLRTVSDSVTVAGR